MRLIDAVRAVIGQKEATPSAGGVFFEEALVVSVGGTGELTISVPGQTVTAKAVTDEPFRANMKVWASQSTEGWIVHGGKR